ncbi:MAG TPA: putative N-acetylmannosamine-6-phosphate 2-epimerase [Fimbriimonadaceae bacterium]|nr:putative N-acetylmannosamine-6-phosphate 2-epimerase [Fimbriimonadaceae bacterium]
MSTDEFIALLRQSPVIVSAQASPGSPLDDVGVISKLAQASLNEGVKVIRLQGVESIREVKSRSAVPVIGLIKANYEDSSVYITPTNQEVNALLATGCEVIALDGTRRKRPGGDTLRDLIRQIHSEGRLAMADCDSMDSVGFSLEAGADIISTTLSGYTSETPPMTGPDLELVREAARVSPFVIAEGRFSEPWHVWAGLRAGAKGVVIGGAINDPVKQTRKFVRAAKPASGPIGAVDIGGTFIRFGVFSERWELVEAVKTQTQPGRQDRLDWIKRQRDLFGVKRLGIGTGGTVDPTTKVVWEAKHLIPEHEGTDFSSLGDVVALNDGHATAWGHACLPSCAGKRTATLALGTGVGFGWVDQGRIMMGSRGEYTRLNDLIFDSGRTVEDVLGGLSLGPDCSVTERSLAQTASDRLVDMVFKVLYPEELFVCGGVGLAPWLQTRATPSPFGANAGLFGAAALALYANV